MLERLSRRCKRIAPHRPSPDRTASSTRQARRRCQNVRQSLRRRQLSTSQRAEVARTLKPLYEDQAKARQSAVGGDRKSVMANLPQAIDGKGAARDQAAAAVGVSGRTVQDAEYVHQHAGTASEIRIRAERRLGEMIRAQKDGDGLNRGGWEQRNKSCGTPEEPQDTTPTLSDIGISKKLSSRSQAIASIPECFARWTG